MPCLPGMPCYEPFVRIVYPRGSDPYANVFLDSDHVRYVGDSLSSSGIQNNDLLNLVIQKLDNKIRSKTLISEILLAIENDVLLKSVFCQLVSNCIALSNQNTTTSTTTI